MLNPAVQQPADIDLMHAICERDEAALEALYDRYSSLVYALCLRILRRHSDAQTVLSDVFWEIWQKADRYNPSRGTARNYLLTMARSRALDRVRAASTRSQREDEASREQDREWRWREESNDPLAATIADEDRQQVVAALGELAEAQKEALQLAYFGGLTQREISERLGMPLGTVKTNIRQGLMRLRRALCSAASERRES